MKTATQWGIFMLLFVMLVAPFATTDVSAQETWTQETWVIDSTGRLDNSFVQSFNQKVDGTNLPIYLLVVDESLLNSNTYTDSVALDIYDGVYGDELGSLMDRNFIMIAVAPFVDSNSPWYDQAVVTLIHGGIYDPLNSGAGPDIAIFIDDETYYKGSWENAVFDSLGEIKKAVDQLEDSSTAPSQAAPQQQSSAPQQQVQPVVVNENPIDYSKVWMTLLSILAGVTGLVIIAFVYVSWSKKTEMVRDAKAKAKQAFQGAVNLIEPWETMIEELRTRIQLLSLKATETTVAELQRRLLEIEKMANQPSISFGELSDSYNNPEAATAEFFDRLAIQFSEQITQPMKLAHGKQKELSQEVSRLESLSATVPSTIADSKKSLAKAQKQLTLLEKYTVTGMATKLDRVQALITRAETAVGNFNFEVAQENAEKANEMSLEVIKEAGKFVQRINDLRVELENSTNLLPERSEDVQEAEVLVAKLAQNFNRESWDELEKNPVRAAENFKTATELLAKVKTFLQEQKWDEAEASIKEANLALREVEMLTISIEERVVTLESAKANMPKLMKQVMDDVATTGQYIQAHDVDIPEQLEIDLEAIDARIQRATVLMAENLPDYMEVKEILTVVRKTTDQILDKAQDAVTTMARVSKSASSEVDDATNAVERVENYLDDHRRDVKSKAKKLYAEAQELLQNAENALKAGNLLASTDGKEEKRLSHYRLAERYADDAYNKAKSALSRAKQNVKEANYVAPPTYTPTYSTYSPSPRRDTYSAPKSNWGSSTPSRPSVSRTSNSRPSVSRTSRSRPSVSRSRSSRPSVSRSSRPSVSRGSRRR